MYRRKTASLSAAFVLGAALAEYGRMPFWCILAAGGFFWMLLAGYFVSKAKDRPAVPALLFAAALAAAAIGGSGASHLHRSFYGACEERFKDGRECLLRGEVYRREETGRSYLYYLKNCRAGVLQKQYFCGRVLVYLDVCDYSIGEILDLEGTVKAFQTPPNEGGYDEKAYYRSRKIGFGIVKAKVIAVSGRRDAFRERLYTVKGRLAESYQNAMPDADAGVLTAMVLGDKGRMDAGRARMYREAGISHFYSISGLHITLLGMALYRLLRKCGAPYPFSCGLAAVWMAVYGELVGFGISASRAIGMFLALMYAKCRGRSYDRPTALALMAAVLAGSNPGVLHHAGYLLSFGAVTGVVMAEWLLSQTAEKKGRAGRGSIWGSLREALVVSVCIQIVAIPVMCSFFYEISVYAVLLNLLVLPCMGALLGFGALGGALGCFFPFAGKLVLYPCYLILLLFDAACGLVLKLPSAVLVTGALSFARLVCWYGAVFLFLAARLYGRALKGAALPGLCLALCTLLLFRGVPRFEIDILDVGQGDGIYISAGDGTALFLDGGSTDVKGVGTYRILPFLKCRGIKRVDYWFVSHCDADHVNGLREVMEGGYAVGCLAVSEFMPEDEAWQALKELAGQREIPILAMSPGDAVKGKDGKWSMKCLYPGRRMAGRNESSLVLLYESRECTGFFGGDIGTAEEEALLSEYKLPKADVYKASHHGSDTSNGRAVLEALCPGIAVISCSLGNSYGHPGKETLKRLKETSGRIYETRYLGQIKITGVHLEGEVSSMLKYRYEDD